jgi:2-iminobutanoate/2-iminopropanoate deaminase
MTSIHRIRTPDHTPEPISHYTDGVAAGGWVHVSGMLALDRDGKLVGGDDVAAQTERVLENVGAVLRQAGAGFEHVARAGRQAPSSRCRPSSSRRPLSKSTPSPI